MTKVKIKIDVSQVRRAHRKFLADLKTEIDASLAEAGEHAKAHVRTDSELERRSKTRSVKDATKARVMRTKGGKLVRLTNSKMRRGYDVSVGLEHGTRPHTIRARSGVLRFRSGGAVKFRKSVWHPGTKPYKFLFKASTSAYGVLGVSLRTRLARLARRF